MKKFKKLLTLSAITFIHFSLSAQQWSGNNNTTDIISIGSNTVNINVSSLASGNYYVGLVINGQIVDSKIINKL